MVRYKVYTKGKGKRKVRYYIKKGKRIRLRKGTKPPHKKKKKKVKRKRKKVKSGLVNDARKEASLRQKQSAENRANILRARAALKKEYEKKLKILEDELATMRAKGLNTAVLQAEIDRLNKVYDDLDKYTKTVVSNFEAYKTQCVDDTKRLKAEKLDWIQKSNQTILRCHDDLKAARDDSDQLKAEKKDYIDRSKQVVEDVKREYSAKIKASKDELKAAQQKMNDHLRSTVDALTKRYTSKMRAQSKSMKKACDERLSSTVDEITKHHRTQMRAQSKNMRKSRDNAVEKLNDKNTKLSSERDNIVQNNSKLKQLHREQEAYIGRLRAEQKELLSKVNRLKRQKKKSTSKASAKETDRLLSIVKEIQTNVDSTLREEEKKTKPRLEPVDDAKEKRADWDVGEELDAKIKEVELPFKGVSKSKALSDNCKISLARLTTAVDNIADYIRSESKAKRTGTYIPIDAGGGAIQHEAKAQQADHMQEVSLYNELILLEELDDCYIEFAEFTKYRNPQKFRKLDQMKLTLYVYYCICMLWILLQRHLNGTTPAEDREEERNQWTIFMEELKSVATVFSSSPGNIPLRTSKFNWVSFFTKNWK